MLFFVLFLFKYSTPSFHFQTEHHPPLCFGIFKLFWSWASHNGNQSFQKRRMIPRKKRSHEWAPHRLCDLPLCHDTQLRENYILCDSKDQTNHFHKKSAVNVAQKTFAKLCQQWHCSYYQTQAPCYMINLSYFYLHKSRKKPFSKYPPQFIPLIWFVSP